jgi:hypothetical protein
MTNIRKIPDLKIGGKTNIYSVSVKMIGDFG